MATLCAVAVLMVERAGLAQNPMPLESPLKPVTRLPDWVPLPRIDDPQAEGFEELIVELRAGREAQCSEFAFARGKHMWVPAVPVFELVGLRADVDSLGVLSYMLEPQGLGLHLYPREREAWRGTYYRFTHEDDMFLHEGHLYAMAVDLAWVLDVLVYEDFEEMTVIFDGIEHLPLGRRLQRERMRRVHEMFASEPDLIYEPERLPWSGATLDWAVAVPAFEMVERTNYQLGFGGAVFGGAAEARYRGQLDGGGHEDFDARWQGVWPDQAWLRQLSVGGTGGTGPRPRAIDGVSLGNSPYLRSTEFGQTILRGQLPPGWEVEVYRNGRLLAWDRIDERGLWEFSVPVDYGQNPIEIRSYGPNGEMQISERAVRIDFDRLPHGQFEYGLSAGRTDYRGAAFAANADVRYGISSSWTARGGYDGYRLDSAADQHYPYLSVTGSVMNPIRVGAERVENAWWWSGASLESSSDFRLGFQHYRYDRTDAHSVLVTPGDRHRSLLDFFWRPLPERRGLFFNLDAERLQTELDRRSRFSIGGTTLIRNMRLSLQLRESFDRSGAVSSRQSALGIQSSLVLRSGSRDWWHGTQVRLQSELDIGSGRDDWFMLSLGRRVGSQARLEIGGGWQRSSDAAQFTLSLTSAGPHAYINAWMTGRDRQGASASLSAEGSLLYDTDRERITTYPFRSLGRGGLTGTVFLDANNNGVFDAGEEPVPGARLVAGYLVAETDEFGRYSIWNLVPFEAADIHVEPASLANPTWVPAFDLASAPISPNGFRRIDLPLVEALEIEGRILSHYDGAMHHAGAVPLTLVEIDGSREYHTRCFSDGEFYIMGVVPGRYRMEIDEQWLETRGLRIAPHTDPTIDAVVGAGIIEFELILEPRA
jgi:hypothetical protein